MRVVRVTHQVADHGDGPALRTDPQVARLPVRELAG
jgi:hypothetical protein